MPRRKSNWPAPPPRLPLFKWFIFLWTAAVFIFAWQIFSHFQAAPSVSTEALPVEHSLRTVSTFTSNEPAIAVVASSIAVAASTPEPSPPASPLPSVISMQEFPSPPAAFNVYKEEPWTNPRAADVGQGPDDSERDHDGMPVRSGVPGPQFPMPPTRMSDGRAGIIRDGSEMPFAFNRLPGVFPRDIDRMIDRSRILGAFPGAFPQLGMEQGKDEATAEWFRELHEEFARAAEAKILREGLPEHIFGQQNDNAFNQIPPVIEVSASPDVTPSPEVLRVPDLKWNPVPLPSLLPSLGQIEMESQLLVAYDTVTARRQAVKLQLGDWKIKFPRFIRLSHVLWWQQYEFARMRRKSKCLTVLHPQLFHPTIQVSRLNSIPGDLTLARDVVKAALGEDPVPSHDGWFSYCEESDKTGEVVSLKDVVVSHPSYGEHPCSQADRVDTLLRAAEFKKDLGIAPTQVGPLFWGYVTAAPFFQHWTQNVLPKIAMATLAEDSLYNSTDGTIWTATQELLPKRFPIVSKLYTQMGWAEPTDLGSTALATPQLIYACNSPPLHPFLWQLGQQRLFRVKHVPITERKKIVYCGRRGNIENVGRKVLNERDMFSLLAEWGRSSDFEIVEFNHTQYSTVIELIEFWSSARALIGPHGGCFTNVVFMPANALVIEAFPLFRGVNRATRGMGQMMYIQSMFLEHEYWMLPSYSHIANGNFKLDLQHLCEILVTSLGPPSANAQLCSNPIVYKPDYVDYVSESIRSIQWG
jgi:hypothetical protein